MAWHTHYPSETTGAKDPAKPRQAGQPVILRID